MEDIMQDMAQLVEQLDIDFKKLKEKLGDGK